MKRATFVWAILFALTSSSAWAWGKDKNTCDEFDSIRLKRECWKVEGKSEWQLDKEEDEREEREKRLKKARKEAERRAKEARERDEERAEEAARRRREQEERDLIAQLENERAQDLKESRVIKTFFYDDLKYLGKLVYLADGIRPARIVTTINGKTEYEVEEEISNADDVCLDLGFYGQLEGTTAEKSRFFTARQMSDGNRRKHGTSVVGVQAEEDGRKLIKKDETSYDHFNVFTRITCYRDKLDTDEDLRFTLEDYDRELANSKVSTSDNAERVRPQRSRITIEESKYTSTDR